MGILAATIANTAPQGEKDKHIFQPHDFIPKWDQTASGAVEKPVETDEERARKRFTQWQSAMAALGYAIPAQVEAES
jgi:hypothetical protein